jgi:hypothetical protein
MMMRTEMNIPPAARVGIPAVAWIGEESFEGQRVQQAKESRLRKAGQIVASRELSSPERFEGLIHFRVGEGCEWLMVALLRPSVEQPGTDQHEGRGRRELGSAQLLFDEVYDASFAGAGSVVRGQDPPSRGFQYFAGIAWQG